VFFIGKNMSLELQERADRITKELKEALIPLRNEIQKMKESNFSNNKNIAK
jgi:hypothetical protein